ncbi:Nif3-like dinuclear metal center hexameric protein [Candidatus Micrarchaeota archaeon RBG_16_36_9]|nr:MAG: Nif3-like dinuclear metal center hexameric protein [Candidatus Micrarchaeota archaeon RBG_16_36_9]
MKLNSIVKFLNKELKIKNIKDISKNGLQVRASENVNKIGLSVDACMDAFKKAKKLNCDLIIVHHGLFWKKQKDVSNITKNRVKFLKKNKISLYTAHLPLDKHIKYGNNVEIFRLLNAKPKELFGGVGYFGYLEDARNLDSIVKELNKKLDTKCKVLKFGKSKIKKIAVVSGYGAPDVLEAIKKKVDLLITGETSHAYYDDSEEGRMNVIFAGHYKTETLGVKALSPLLKKKFGLKTVFIDSPTGL